jgi:O-antigen ligase
MEPFVLIGAIVLAVWAAAVLWRGGTLAGCLLVMLAGTCFSTDFFVLDMGPLKLTLDRVLWCVVILQYLVWRWQGWHDPKPLKTSDQWLFLFVGYLALRTFTSDWSSNNSAPLLHLVLWYVMPLGIYWIIRQSNLSRQAVLTVLGCMAAFGAYLAIIVVAEKFEAYWLVYPQYIVTSMADKKAEFVGRGRGPLLNPMGTGILVVACWCAMLLWSSHWRGVWRALVVPWSVLMAMAVYCSMTRSVWMGAGLAIAVVAGATVPRHWRIPVLGGAMLAAVLVAATNWERIVAFQRDRNLTAKETADSVRVRPVLAAVAWNMFRERPWFGCGFDQYANEHKYFLADRSTDLVLEKVRGMAPHNVFLAMLTETGLVGLALFAGLLVLWARDAWRLWRSPCAPLWARQQGLLFLAVLGAYLANGMFHHVVYVPAIDMLLFLVAGITAGLQPWAVASTGRTGPEQTSNCAATLPRVSLPLVGPRPANRGHMA